MQTVCHQTTHYSDLSLRNICLLSWKNNKKLYFFEYFSQTRCLFTISKRIGPYLFSLFVATKAFINSPGTSKIKAATVCKDMDRTKCKAILYDAGSSTCHIFSYSLKGMLSMSQTPTGFSYLETLCDVDDAAYEQVGGQVYILRWNTINTVKIIVMSANTLVNYHGEQTRYRSSKSEDLYRRKAAFVTGLSSVLQIMPKISILLWCTVSFSSRILKMMDTAWYSGPLTMISQVTKHVKDNLLCFLQFWDFGITWKSFWCESYVCCSHGSIVVGFDDRSQQRWLKSTIEGTIYSFSLIEIKIK